VPIRLVNKRMPIFGVAYPGSEVKDFASVIAQSDNSTS
jgi:hypothetical protein